MDRPGTVCAEAFKIGIIFFLQNLIVYLSSFSLLSEAWCGEISVLLIDK